MIEQDNPNLAKTKWLLSQVKPKFQRLGCGIHNDNFYFGTTLYEGKKRFNAIITSDKKIYIDYPEEKQIQNYGINYRFDLFDDCIDNLWNNKSITSWLYDKVEDISIETMFNKILKLNKNFIEHNPEEKHIFVACDILSSYFMPVFLAKGRTYFKADYKSGKTKQSLIYKLLSFNPIMAGNITPAMLDRVAESTCGTMIIDNFDNLPEDFQKPFLQFIQVYYKSGLKNVKGTEHNHRPQVFDGFSPLVLNNLATIGLDKVTESRCNVVTMVQSDNKDITSKEIDEKKPFWAGLRDQLHICALQNWKQVHLEYNRLNVPELTDGRELENIKPHLAIAKCINQETYDKLLSWVLNEKEQRQIKDVSNDWQFWLFKAIYEIIGNDKITEITLTDVWDCVRDDVCSYLDDPAKEKRQKQQFSVYAGKVLSSIPLFSKKKPHNIPVYVIKQEDLIKMINVKGYTEYILNQPNIDNHDNIHNTDNIDNKDNLKGYVGEVCEVCEVKKAQPENPALNLITKAKERMSVLKDLIHKKELINLLSEKLDLDVKEAEALINTLKLSGDIYEPKPDYFELVR